MLTEIIFSMGLKAFIKVTELHEDLKKYTERLKKFKENFMSKAFEAYNPINSNFNVLCHNDLHTKNLMMKFNVENKFEDFYLVSFNN